MKTARLVLVAVAALLATSPFATATVIHVPGDQPTIQAGIEAASAGDTVIVACGTYYEHDINMKSGVCLASATGQADCVTVDASQQGKVFMCNGVDDLASMTGFTITGGISTDEEYPGYAGAGMLCDASSPALTNCTFSGSGDDWVWGGGLCCAYNSSPTLTNCAFSGNQAYTGGGMVCTDFSSPTLDGCTFSGNQAVFVGGLCCMNSSAPTLAGCTFSGNVGTSNGGGLKCYDSSPMLTDCMFSGNLSDTGGGMFCGGNSCPALTRCTFSGNEAAYWGGGMSCGGSSCSPVLVNCTFSRNRAGQEGGGILCYESSSLALSNCIIAFSQEGEALSCFYPLGQLTLVCCDLFANADGDWVGCIADQYGSSGNFSADPHFCDALGNDVRLNAASPCAAANSPTCGLVGAWDVGCDDAVVPTSWGSIKAMFR